MKEKLKLIKLIKKNLFRSSDKDFVQKVSDRVTGGGMPPATFVSLMADMISLESIPEQDLFSIANAMYEENHISLNLEDYFSEFEIRNYKIALSVPQSANIDLRCFSDASPLAENQWTCRVSVAQIAIMKNHNVIWASPDLQRQSTYVASKGSDEILKRIHVNINRVNEIAKKITAQKYNFNTIRINLLDDGETEPPVYDEVKKTISIPEKGELLIIDGNHRTLAATKAYYDNPHLKEYFNNVYFQVAFTFYTPTLAKACIEQEADVERLPAKHKVLIKNSNANIVVDFIKKNSNAEPIYAEKMVTDKSGISLGFGFIEQSLLSVSIESAYKTEEIKLRGQLKEISDWIVDVFNFATAKYSDIIIDYKNQRKTSWLVHSEAWMVFVYLSAMLFGQNNWKQRMDETLEKINWDVKDKPKLGGRVGGFYNIIQKHLNERGITNV